MCLDTHHGALLLSKSAFVLESYKVDKGDHLSDVDIIVEEDMQYSTVSDDVNDGIFIFDGIFLDIIFGFMDKNDNFGIRA